MMRHMTVLDQFLKNQACFFQVVSLLNTVEEDLSLLHADTPIHKPCGGRSSLPRFTDLFFKFLYSIHKAEQRFLKFSQRFRSNIGC